MKPMRPIGLRICGSEKGLLRNSAVYRSEIGM